MDVQAEVQKGFVAALTDIVSNDPDADFRHSGIHPYTNSAHRPDRKQKC